MNWFSCFKCKQKTVNNVKQLDFSRTSISEVPPEVFHFERTLENLHLDGNKITELPRTLFQCEELRCLDISDNEIQSIPALVSKLVNLQKFNLSRNYIKHSDFPINIHRCQKLTFLDISSNTIEKLPEGITSLVNLQELYLNDTYIDFLPANFGRLNNLQILELRDNNLSALPKSLRRLTALIRLDISNNDFSDMPEVIGNMINLKELWINGNCISALILGIGNLQELYDFDASKNDLESLPKEIGRCTKLSSLILSHNLLKEMPHVIGSLKQLQILKLDYNCLKSLPYTIGDLMNLEEFDVQNNQLAGIPNTFGFLRKLNYFIASHNFISSLPTEIGSCTSLSIINFHNNMLRKLPDEIGHLQKLTSLGLIGNRLEYLPIPLARLPNLRALWLSQNQSHPLIPLQTEQLETSGQLVLTCFLLPQVQSPVEDIAKSLPAETLSLSKQRHIAFSEPGVTREPLPKLTRAPTPYPKDFQRFQRSLSNQLRKNRDPASPIGPAVVASLNVNADSDSVQQIKEAKVTPMGKGFLDQTTGGTEFNTQSYVPTQMTLELPEGVLLQETISKSEDLSALGVEMEEKCTLLSAGNVKHPPPYHIAAAYSKNAKYFNQMKDTLEIGHQDETIKELAIESQSNLQFDTSQSVQQRLFENNEQNVYNDECSETAKKIVVVLTPCSYVLGFTVFYNEHGVFVNRVYQNGNAFEKLYTGDKILMLDSTDLTKMEPLQAYKTVLSQGPKTESFYITRKNH